MIINQRLTGTSLCFFLNVVKSAQGKLDHSLFTRHRTRKTNPWKHSVSEDLEDSENCRWILLPFPSCFLTTHLPGKKLGHWPDTQSYHDFSTGVIYWNQISDMIYSILVVYISVTMWYLILICSSYHRWLRVYLCKKLLTCKSGDDVSPDNFPTKSRMCTPWLFLVISPMVSLKGYLLAQQVDNMI